MPGKAERACSRIFEAMHLVGTPMRIDRVEKGEYPELLAVWEASVRATHDFLAQEDIAFLKPLILQHSFDAVELRCVRDEQGRILGFCGTSEGRLEMLFVSPESRGRGIGSALCGHAITMMNVREVDVNEQNPKALGFYKHLGFRVVGRSPVDGQGKPYPLLHMKLD